MEKSSDKAAFNSVMTHSTVMQRIKRLHKNKAERTNKQKNSQTSWEKEKSLANSSAEYLMLGSSTRLQTQGTFMIPCYLPKRLTSN